MPRLKELFTFAQQGIKKLMETYKNCSIISLCLNYYYAIIVNHIEQKYNDTIFYKDYLTSFYSKELIESLNNQWTKERIRIILDLVTFLNISPVLESNVKSLETIMENNDVNSQYIITNI